MKRRVVSNPEQSVAGVTNLPVKTSDLNRLEIAQLSGGFIWDTIGDYISEELGIDVPDLDVHPWSW